VNGVLTFALPIFFEIRGVKMLLYFVILVEFSHCYLDRNINRIQ
jgi:hypothetical protein